jgi:hypothetical protein
MHRRLCGWLRGRIGLCWCIRCRSVNSRRRATPRRDRIAGSFRNDALSDTIGFSLIGITGLADAQFCLNRAGLKQAQHGLVAEGLLQSEERIGRLLRGLWGTLALWII